MGDVDVLLVEDNHGDVNLIRRAFEEREFPGELHTVQTGAEALDWLYRREDFAAAPRPDLVLLDLNLPATSGHDVLAEIKSDARLRRIPVVVLTGTSSREELSAVYESHANACLMKPVDPNDYADLLERFADFWMATAALPPDPDSGDGT